MARALVVARAKLTQDPNWKNISDSRRGRDSVQKAMAHELCRQVGVDPSQSSDLSDAKKFQDLMKDNQIVILSKDFLMESYTQAHNIQNSVCTCTTMTDTMIP